MNDVKGIVKRHGFVLKKSLGQNFLINDDVLEDIVDAADIESEDLVLEIGPGAGNLTRLLAEKAKAVICIEVDDTLIPILRETVGRLDNVKVICADALKCDLEKVLKDNYADIDPEGVLPPQVKCVANLPYYITTPLVMKVLEEGKMISSMTLMMQKEVAMRICAEFQSSDIGAVTFAVKYNAMAKMVFDVEPDNFFPEPGVISTVVRFDRLNNPPVSPLDPEYMFKLIKASFAQRRKTLINALSNAPYVGKSKEKIKDAIDKAGLAANVRGEKLTLNDFSLLADLLTGP